MLGQELHNKNEDTRTKHKKDQQLAMKHRRRVAYICPDELGMPCRFTAGESG